MADYTIYPRGRGGRRGFPGGAITFPDGTTIPDTLCGKASCPDGLSSIDIWCNEDPAEAIRTRCRDQNPRPPGAGREDCYHTLPYPLDAFNPGGFVGPGGVPTDPCGNPLPPPCPDPYVGCGIFYTQSTSVTQQMTGESAQTLRPVSTTEVVIQSDPIRISAEETGCPKPLIIPGAMDCPDGYTYCANSNKCVLDASDCPPSPTVTPTVTPTVSVSASPAAPEPSPTSSPAALTPTPTSSPPAPSSTLTPTGSTPTPAI